MENIEFRTGAVDASDCIGEGWNFIKSNYGLFIGMGVVEAVITIAASLIPYAGSFIGVIVGAALTCGIYIALLRQRRGEEVPFSLMFEGFSRVVPVTLVRVIAAIPVMIFGLAITSFIALPTLAPDGSNIGELTAVIFNRSFIVPVVGGYAVVLVVSFVFNALLFFAAPLIADRNVGTGDALRLSFNAALNNFGGVLLLLILETLLAFAGALCCGIGIIFVIPVIYAANIAAYKRVFPDEEPQFNNQPPRPEDYGGTYGTPQ